MRKRKVAAWGFGLLVLGFVLGEKETPSAPSTASSPEWSSQPTPIAGQGVCWTEHKADGSDEYLCSGQPTTTTQVAEAEDGSQVPKSFYDTVDTEPVMPLSGDCDADGRCHPCGVETEDGVTENLDAYEARCGGER